MTAPLLFALFAQTVAAPVDPISGGAGWVGAGLLGLVLAWLLLKHIPSQAEQTRELVKAKDDQTRELILAKDEAVRDAIKSFAAQLAIIQADGKAALAQVVAHCEREFSQVSEVIRAGQVQITNMLAEFQRVFRPALYDDQGGGPPPAADHQPRRPARGSSPRIPRPDPNADT